MRIERPQSRVGAGPAREGAETRSQAQKPEHIQRAAWVVLSALGLMALMYALPARAAGEVAVDEGGTVVDVTAGRGMASSNPRVRPILAAHPGQYVTICVAGCGGKPHAVQVLPGPTTARVGGFVPSTAKLGNETYGPPRPAALGGNMAAQENDVVCVAGCAGRPGQVLQRVSDLPPSQKAAKRKSSQEKRYQPLNP